MITTLLLSDQSKKFDAYSYYRCWDRAFLSHPDLQTTRIDIQSGLLGLPGLISAVLSKRYDLIVLHPSIVWRVDSKWWTLLSHALRRRQCPKVIFFLNEYRFLRRQLNAAIAIRATIAASQFPQDVAEKLYASADFHGQVLSMPNAVDTDVFHADTDWDSRTIDVGFRGDAYPTYLGHDERAEITSYFQSHQDRLGLRTDIAVGNQSRFSDKDWNNFMNRCKAIIGHEAGGHFIDLDDTFRNFFTHTHATAPEPVFKQLLNGIHSSGIHPYVLSGRIAAPRHLEALATRTIQILFPGRYNDLIQPEEHYIPLQTDFSNIGEVMEKFRDKKYCDAMLRRGEQHVQNTQQYRHRVDKLLTALKRIH